MVRDAQVTLSAVSTPSDVVTVLGAVVKPGTFPAFGDLTLLDYIADANGFQEAGLGTAINASAANYTVTLTRPSLNRTITIPLGKNPERSLYGGIHLFPGDTVFVDKLGVIYAVGAFRNQGEFPLKNSGGTTVMQLVALAGGVGFEGDRRDAHIVRVVENGRVAIPIDIQSILKGTKPDIELQADDILFVPSNDLKAAIKGGGSGLIVSLASSFLLSR
jgi:polysaccharide export outer membrane protein